MTETASTMIDQDHALMQQAAQGDLAAFEQLMRRYNQTLFRTARSILIDDMEA
ncbi:hypothetical protein [Orrella sp. 11846]|uniref:hypothetical protein n=1 Tax=Orrella sp. 11846 TaxID=3409913 RepID=UPI003B5B9D5A